MDKFGACGIPSDLLDLALVRVCGCSRCGCEFVYSNQRGTLHRPLFLIENPNKRTNEQLGRLSVSLSLLWVEHTRTNDSVERVPKASRGCCLSLLLLPHAKRTKTTFASVTHSFIVRIRSGGDGRTTRETRYPCQRCVTHQHSLFRCSRRIPSKVRTIRPSLGTKSEIYSVIRYFIGLTHLSCAATCCACLFVFLQKICVSRHAAGLDDARGWQLRW